MTDRDIDREDVEDWTGRDWQYYVDKGVESPTPTLVELVQELRRELGLFDGAMPVSPKQAWEEAIDVVRGLRRGYAYVEEAEPRENPDDFSGWYIPESEAVAVVRRGVESGTIKGEETVRPHPTGGWPQRVLVIPAPDTEDE